MFVPYRAGGTCESSLMSGDPAPRDELAKAAALSTEVESSLANS